LLSSTTGFENAPTTHGVLIPSLMALFSAVSANYLLKEKISKVQLCGYFLIILGVILRFEASSLNDDYITADSYFVLSAVLWTIYSIQYKKTGLDPIVATAFVTVGSMIIMIPPYIIYQLNNPHSLDISGSIVQIVFQGLLASIVALITFNKSVQILGASKATSFAALVPALVVIFAAPILDEQPDIDDIIFVILMSFGVLLASGAIKKPSKLV